MDKRDKSSFMSRAFPKVTPLTQHKKETTAAQPRAIKNQSSANASLAETTELRITGDSRITGDDVLNFQGNGIQNRLMKELKRGAIGFDDILDLHGQTIEQAHESCMNFIHHSQQHGYYCVLVIHGRGYRSAEGIPVLKQQTDYWLRQHQAVLAFTSAQDRDGGKGAAYVLLRKSVT